VGSVVTMGGQKFPDINLMEFCRVGWWLARTRIQLLVRASSYQLNWANSGCPHRHAERLRTCLHSQSWLQLIINTANATATQVHNRTKQLIPIILNGCFTQESQSCTLNISKYRRRPEDNTLNTNINTRLLPTCKSSKQNTTMWILR